MTSLFLSGVFSQYNRWGQKASEQIIEYKPRTYVGCDIEDKLSL